MENIKQTLVTVNIITNKATYTASFSDAILAQEYIDETSLKIVRSNKAGKLSHFQKWWRMRWDLKFPCGKTISEAKRLLENTTHCGQYWGVKAKYSISDNEVYVYMEGNEKVTFNMSSGERKIYDLDY